MNIYTSKSIIHGIGVFSNKSFKKYEFIFTAIEYQGNITEYGSKINHSFSPNSILIKNLNDNSYDIYSNSFINKDTEITTDYTFTPDFIKKPKSYNPPLI